MYDRHAERSGKRSATPHARPTHCPYCATDTGIEREAPSILTSLSLDEFETLARNEWRRRLVNRSGRSAYRRRHPRRFIRALIMYAIEPDSPVREATVNELLIGDASGKKSHLKEGIVMPHSKDRTCYVAPIETSVDSEALKRSVKTLFRIVGMGCPTCVTRVRNSLLSAPGVLRARIDLRSGLASVDYDPTRTEKEALLDAVAAAGDGRHAYRAVLF